MRLPSWFHLLAKEFRELFASRAYWLMLIIVGALVGHGFITAVRLYSEVSGNGSAPAALPQALTSLDGILVPTWGAYDLAAMLLFPFVAIRLIAAEKESGALKLLLQLPNSLTAKLTAKGIVLVAGWLIAWIPGVVAIVLWKEYGGHVYRQEAFNLMLGHLLRGLLSAGFAVGAAAVAESAASAAIVTLGMTVGSWMLDFIAAGRGGLWQQVGAYTPTAALRSFEQGLLRPNVVLVMITLSLSGFALAAIWLHKGRSLQRRALLTVLLFAVVCGACIASARVRSSRDMSENRRNSFSVADEKVLAQIHEPLTITVFLAPEDPRLTDLELNVLKKLGRVLPALRVNYASASTTGLFAGEEDHYGQIWYEMAGKKIMDRSTIEEVVLGQIYQLAGVSAPERDEGNEFPGYPLATSPKGASLIFYVIWPALVVLAWWLVRK